MRRMMQSLIAVAILASSAAAQTELTLDAGPASTANNCSPCVVAQPAAVGCGNGSGSQMAHYMNSYPTHPNLWGSYAAERAARLDCLYHHLNGCNCQDPKRNLHSHPSTICSGGSGACEASGCDHGIAKAGKPQGLFGMSQLHTQASGSVKSQPLVIVVGKTKPAVSKGNEARAPEALNAKPANAGVAVTHLR